MIARDPDAMHRPTGSAMSALCHYERNEVESKCLGTAIGVIYKADYAQDDTVNLTHSPFSQYGLLCFGADLQ